jgi:hypothetical protein
MRVAETGEAGSLGILTDACFQVHGAQAVGGSAERSHEDFRERRMVKLARAFILVKLGALTHFAAATKSPLRRPCGRKRGGVEGEE